MDINESGSKYFRLFLFWRREEKPNKKPKQKQSQFQNKNVVWNDCKRPRLDFGALPQPARREAFKRKSSSAVGFKLRFDLWCHYVREQVGKPAQSTCNHQRKHEETGDLVEKLSDDSEKNQKAFDPKRFKNKRKMSRGLYRHETTPALLLPCNCGSTHITQMFESFDFFHSPPPPP